MKRLIRRFGSLLLLLATLPASVRAQTSGIQYFLKLDAVKGDSTDSAFKDQIVASGFDFSVTNVVSGGVAGGPGKGVPGNLVILKHLDIATPVLAQSASQGTAYAQAVLTVLTPVKGEQKVLYTITLKNVFVSGLVQAGSPVITTANPGGQPTEMVSFRYSSVQWQVASAKGGYDFSQNKGLDVQPNSPPPDLKAARSQNALAASLPVHPAQ